MREHRYADMEYVRNNPNECWSKYWLSMNRQLTVKDVKTLILPNSIDEWNWDIISQYIDIREVRNNPDEWWNKDKLSCNRTLTVEDAETLVLPYDNNSWNWRWISYFIDIQQIINNPNKPWHRHELRLKNGITGKILEFFDARLLKHLQKNIPKFRYHTDIVVKC